MTTTLKQFPYWDPKDLDDLATQLRMIANIRKDDIAQIQNLSNIFVGGRLVGKIPVNSADVDASDRINDVSRDNTHTYVLQNEGSPQWIRYTGSAF